MSARRPVPIVEYLCLADSNSTVLGGWDAKDVDRWAKLGGFGSHRNWLELRSVTPFMHLHQI